jgi:hypothetical protein
LLIHLELAGIVLLLLNAALMAKGIGHLGWSGFVTYLYVLRLNPRLHPYSIALQRK